MSLLTQERIEDALPPKGPGFGAMAQRNTQQRVIIQFSNSSVQDLLEYLIGDLMQHFVRMRLSHRE